MPITVSPNAQHDIAITTYGRNSFHYEMIFNNNDKENPTCCGLLTAREHPEGNTFGYTFTAYVIVLEGEIDMEDKNNPGKIILKAGDVVRIDKGTTVRWSSPSYGKAFYSAEVTHEVNIHDLLV